MEKYIDCKSYEGIYQVSNLGNVKSLSRFIENGNGGYISKEKILKKSKNKKNGYLYVSLCLNAVSKKINVHQLVAINFLNHIPDKTNKVVVDHKDENKENNNLNNLRLISNRANTSRQKDTTSIYPGVYYYSKLNRFRARIRIEGKRFDLGQFKTEEEANNAYKNALQNI